MKSGKEEKKQQEPRQASDPRISHRGKTTGSGQSAARRSAKVAVSNDTPPAKKKSVVVATHSSTTTGAAVNSKLNSQQVAELLKGFWVELLQNNVRQVKKILVENRQRMDFNAARYPPAAFGTALHLCAQHGLLEIARLLLVALPGGAIIDLNVQNKVGSTALHVACKFHQEAVVGLLLELHARVDIPDCQNHIAFDVAPFAIIDKFLLAPLREQVRVEESENDKIDAEYDKVCAAFDEAVRGYANEAMAVSDIESQAWAESLLLQASRARDREWSDRVQDARELLESQREVYRQHELVLEETQESITAMRNKIMVDVERDQMKAQNQVAEMTQLVDKTTHELAEKEAALNDELGFLDAANEFPNDADVQEWILTTIVALLDGHEPNDSEVVAEELLLRPEFGAVVQNALTRFPTVHRLQWRAVACLATLVARATSLLEQDDESLWRAGRSKNALISFLDSLIAMKINVLTLCRDAITRFNRDVELNALVASIHFHLLRVRLPSSNSSSSIQCAVRFGHEPRNQLLPMELLQLFESSQAHWSDNPRGYHVTIRDASFLLFTVTKCNAEKALLQNHAIPMIVRLVLCLSSSSETASVPFLDLDELKTESLQYLLASLTFLHAVTWFPSMSATVAMNRGTRAVQNAKRELEDIHPWTVDGLMELLTALSPMLAPSIDCTLPRYCHLVAFWMLKLLRNLVLHRGPAAHSVRVRLYDAKLFDILANVKEIAAGLAETSGSRLINGFIDTPDQPARDEVIGVWLDLVEEVWIRHYNASGQLQPTVAYAVDHVLALLSSVTQDMSDSALEATLNANTRVLCATALLATNERNAIRIGTHGNKVDAAVSVFLQWLLKLRLLSFASSDGSRNELQGHSELVFEAVVHVLRIYLALFTEQVKSVAGGHPPCRILHDRCRAVGICVILRAFRDWNAQRNGEARNEGSEAVVEVRRSTTKKPARTEPCGVTRREASSGEDAAARRIVIALSRAVDDIVQCKC